MTAPPPLNVAPSLAEAEVGQLVALRSSGFGARPQLVLIERTTATGLWVNGLRYARRTGRRPVERGHSRWSLYPITEAEAQAHLQRERDQRQWWALQRLVEGRGSERLSPACVEAMLAAYYATATPEERIARVTIAPEPEEGA